MFGSSPKKVEFTPSQKPSEEGFQQKPVTNKVFPLGNGFAKGTHSVVLKDHLLTFKLECDPQDPKTRVLNVLALELITLCWRRIGYIGNKYQESDIQSLNFFRHGDKIIMIEHLCEKNLEEGIEKTRIMFMTLENQGLRVIYYC